jgi:prepilin-type N-terminal cleavage/methylation domain-containing protein
MKKISDKKQKGFSLIELMVSITLFALITAVIWGMLQIGRIDRNRASRRSDMLKNARTAVHLIGRDVLNAGMGFHRRGAVVPDNFLQTRLGTPADADSERDILTSIVVGNNIFTNNLNPDTNVRTDIISFAYRDLTFNSGNTISLTNVSSTVTSPEIANLAGQASSARAFDLYLIESDSSQVAVMATNVPNANQIDIAPNDPLALNQAFDGAGVNGSLLKKCTPVVVENCTTYLASAKKFVWAAYKVKEDGTLVRMIFGNNTNRPAAEQIQEQPLAYNIQNFQIKYVLEDGTAVDNPTLGVDGLPGTLDDEPLNSNQIRQITVTLQVLAPENDEQTGRPAVITLNATFSVRNLEYDAG